MHTNGNEWPVASALFRVERATGPLRRATRPPRPGGPLELSRGQRPRNEPKTEPCPGGTTEADAGVPASLRDARVCGGAVRGRCPRLGSAGPPGREPAPPGPAPFAAIKTGNPLAMNRISQTPARQMPCPVRQGSLGRRQGCHTFASKGATPLVVKVAHLWGQRCHTLWDRAGHPRRPGALGSRTWPGNAASGCGLPDPICGITPS